MDLLLGFYFLLFLGVLAFPFVFLAWKYKDESISPFGVADPEELVNLQQEKLILLSNLADLKAEEETGKLKSGEFRSLSQDILLDLERIDQKIQSVGETKKRLESPTPSPRFTNHSCPKCGTKTLEGARFCHNCGTSLS